MLFRNKYTNHIFIDGTAHGKNKGLILISCIYNGEVEEEFALLKQSLGVNTNKKNIV